MTAKVNDKDTDAEISNYSKDEEISAHFTKRFLPFVRDSIRSVFSFLPISEAHIVAEVISDEIDKRIEDEIRLSQAEAALGGLTNKKNKPAKPDEESPTNNPASQATNEADQMIDSVGQNSQQPTQPQDMLEKELNGSWQDDGKEGATEAMKKLTDSGWQNDTAKDELKKMVDNGWQDDGKEGATEAMKKLTDSGWQNDTAKPTKKQIDPEEQLYQDFEADLDKEYADDTESTDKPDQNKEDNEKKEETDEDAPDDDYTYGKANGLPTKQNADTNQEAAPEQEKKQQTAQNGENETPQQDKTSSTPEDQTNQPNPQSPTNEPQEQQEQKDQTTPAQAEQTEQAEEQEKPQESRTATNKLRDLQNKLRDLTEKTRNTTDKYTKPLEKKIRNLKKNKRALVAERILIEMKRVGAIMLFVGKLFFYLIVLVIGLLFFLIPPIMGIFFATAGRGVAGAAFTLTKQLAQYSEQLQANKEKTDEIDKEIVDLQGQIMVFQGTANYKLKQQRQKIMDQINQIQNQQLTL